MTEVSYELHPGQLEVFNHPARFKVVVAGRRWGKTRLSLITLIRAAMQLEHTGPSGREYDLRNREAWYIAPTFKQAEDIAWRELLRLAEPLTRKYWGGNDMRIELKNGRSIQLKSADKPERLRGVGLNSIVLDEYADMKPSAWEYDLEPTLADTEGSALFIGSPQGRNHFYELFLQARLSDDWHAWQFRTLDNPFISEKEVSRAKRTKTTSAFRQEYEASFDTLGAQILDPNQVQVVDAAPDDGHVFMAVDPAGYGSEESVSKSAFLKLDETAIAVVQVGPSGWCVLDIVHGRWDIRETSIRILRTAQKYQPIACGIEKGALKNAIAPYLEDQRRRLGIPLNLVDVTHGGRSKSSRIAWALQGRLEHGRISFLDGDYIRPLREQMFDFPSARHDDMLDALSYIDQVAETSYTTEWFEDDWEPLDEAIGL